MEETTASFSSKESAIFCSHSSMSPHNLFHKRLAGALALDLSMISWSIMAEADQFRKPNFIAVAVVGWTYNTLLSNRDPVP